MGGSWTFPCAGRNGVGRDWINRQRAAAARWQRDVFRGERWRRSQVNAPSLSHDRKALIEARLRPPAKSYRSWPRPIPRIPALRLSAPSVRFIALAIFATDVRAFECALSSLTSSFDHGLRCAVVFFVGTNNLLMLFSVKRSTAAASATQKDVPRTSLTRGANRPFGRLARLIDARAPGIYAMQRFAKTIRQDLEAVRNAMSEPWSNGQTEGQINRLKTLKRAMYGRAGVELLRARMMPL